ncbi:S8 family serine peptidase [Ramlibacter sp. PS4R-6]|uniref:S8 family serine peptidase n=1 Tax=Ramlibacter sp. PS4R-6 TaxID=3133438 RepID=UPI00309CC293
MNIARAAHPWIRRCAAGALACVLASAAHAQVRLPGGIGVPGLPRPTIPQLPQPVQQLVPLQDLRATLTRDLIARNPQRIEADPAGEPIRRAELLWLSPSAAAVQAARAQGFVVLREENLAELDVREVVLRPPPGLPTAAAAQQLRALDAQAAVDFNHLYTPSGDAGAVPAGTAGARRVGLIDAGVDAAHPALHAASIQRWGCDGKTVASEHGTAIASILVGNDGPFRGVQPAATLHAADVYCGEPAGGAAEDVARALAWMARERVAVVNVSLVGPANRLLERAVAALVKRGHVVVAAVGNDGPAAPPLYPASYPGVVGVTGVTPARRVLPEAAQGPQVMFAAPGAEIGAARRGWGYTSARGTSFAAPFVAGLLADALNEPDPQAAAAVIARLAATAIDLGERGRDPVYGFGLVGEGARVSPGRLPAH